MKRIAYLGLAVVLAFGACKQRAVADATTGDADTSSAHADHGSAAGGGMAVPSGYAVVPLAEAERLRVARTTLTEHDFTKTVRTVGVVALDETRTAHVHAKVRGWIDDVSVDFVGRKVASGEGLCTIYSQEVLSAELEFLSVLDRARRPIASGEFADTERRAQEQLLGAARRRLALWDVPADEIARLESTREPSRTFTLHAPRGGVVVAKEAVRGLFVDPAVELYTLSDLRKVWAVVDVYEADVPFVHVGDPAHLTVEGLEEPVHAKVAFLPPTVAEATRTVKARFDLDNTSGRLRPGAFVNATLQLRMGTGVGVPEDAVIRTGPRAIVFVAMGDHLMPREIRIGPLVGDEYRVLAGLVAGEQVATGAQFLLDSESRLRASSTGGGMSGHVH